MTRPDLDEELPGSDRAPGRAGRVLSGVGAVAVIGLAGWAVLQGSGDDPAPSRTSSAPPSTTAPAPLRTAAAAAVPCEDSGGRGPRCAIYRTLPPPVLAAVRRAFPDARVQRSFSAVGESGRLVRRDLLVDAGVPQAEIAIEPGRMASAYRVIERDGIVTIVCTSDVDFGQHVRIVVNTDRGHPVPRAALVRLARDPRLLATA